MALGGGETDETTAREIFVNDPEAFFEKANEMSGNEVSCSTIKMLCNDANRGSSIQQLCPVTCGLCEKDEGEGVAANLRDPGSYRVTGVNYHAHLLGKEMYTTLLREQEEEQALVADLVVSKKKQAPDTAARNNMIAKDLKSREIWFYDDQATIPMDMEYEIEVADGSGNASAMEFIRGVEVKPGDKIQVTCVYDSTARTNETMFGFSTYEEMCLINLFITFETPSVTNDVDFVAELYLHQFSCDEDNENHTSDVWQGILNEEEDPRNIYFDHPIAESDMCTFPVADLGLRDVVTGRTRNCPEGKDDAEDEVKAEEASDVSSSFSASSTTALLATASAIMAPLFN